MGACYHHVIVLCILALSAVVLSNQNRDGDADEERSGEDKLVSDLLARYRSHSRTVRPVHNSTSTFHVNFSLTLIQILDFDELNNNLQTLVWKQYHWVDENLMWDPAEYGDVQSVVLPADRVWVPDIILYNNIGTANVEKHHDTTMITASPDGAVMWYPPVKYHSSCPVSMINYPFDEQECILNFGSWAHDSTKLDLTLAVQDKSQTPDEIQLHLYLENSEWDIIGNSAEKRLVSYPCCKHPWAELTYKLKLSRKVTFHMRLFLIPTPILSLLSIFIFWIPPMRPDRTAFGLTLFSTLFLLLILVVNSTPPTSTARIGQFYVAILKMVFYSVLLSISSINFIHTTRRMPNWIDKVILRTFGFLVCGHSSARACCAKAPPTPSVSDSEKGPFLAAGKASDANNSKKWRTLALIMDRIYFICFIPLLIYNYMVYFPEPTKMLSLIW